MKKVLTIILIMGLFSKLFGQNSNSNSSQNSELRVEYNVMHNIKLVQSNKYIENPSRYKLIEDGIYQDLKDGDDAKYRMTISYELDSNETNNQYPLEDILDKYLMFVSDDHEDENKLKNNRFKIELGGYLDKMINAKTIIGKKVYNQQFVHEDGQIRVKLVIE